VANLNVFSEGHRDFQIGPGYQNPAWQTTLYEPATLVRGPVTGRRELSRGESGEPARQKRQRARGLQRPQ
jgi:hypothetical protein